MWKQRKKRMITGMFCLCLSVLAGCGNETEENHTGEEQEQVQENIQEESPELKKAEKPQFLRDGIRRVSLKENGEEIFSISREPAAYKMDFDYWEILNPYDEFATVNTEEMYALFDALCGLDFQTSIQAEEGMDTGIQDSDTSITIDFVDTMEEETAQDTESADATAEIVLGKEDGQGNRYAAVKESEETLYLLSAADLEAIYQRNPFDYLLKIPVLISVDTVERMELTLDGATHEMQVDSSKGEYAFGKKQVEKETFAALYQEISGIMLAGELEEESEIQEEPLLRVVYHRNMEQAPQVQAAYYSYDDTYNMVEINENSRFLVNAEDVQAVIEKIRDAF